MKQKVWRHYEHIPGIDWIYTGGILLNCTSRLHEFGIKNYISEALATLKHFDNNFYFHPEEFRKTQQDILQRVLADPDWGLLFNCKLKKLTENYFLIARQIEKMNLRPLSNKNLANLWRKLCQAKEDSHAAGVITTWIIDADDQPFTKYLINLISNLTKKARLKDGPHYIFSILTTPLENSYIQEEEIALLKLFKEMKKMGLANLWPRLNILAKKYGWIYYKFLGPARTPKEYEILLKQWSRQRIDPQIKLNEISKKKKELKEKQQNFVKLLNLDSNSRKIIQFAQQIVFLKDYRKMSQFYGSFVNEKILKEIAKRLSLSLKQVRHFLPWEISPALLEKNFNPDILNQRYEFSVFYSRGANFQLLTGQKARNFLKKQEFEKIEIDIKELKGAGASPGKAQGHVKIINLPEEIGKIKKGEIMVSHATYPALVPAMKKSAAIITDEGGLTCHAAIVSRELGIPCIVGTKIATKVLKDGDLVEADANKGVVRILKK